MGTITRAEYLRLTGKSATGKPRRKVGEGTLAKRKAWLCRQASDPLGLFIPFKVLSPNRRAHWAKTAKAYEMPRVVLGADTLDLIRHHGLTLPVTVTMIRYGRKLLDGHDNLRMAFKPLADEVAKCFGVADKDEAFTWVYLDELAPDYGVRIVIQRRS